MKGGMGEKNDSIIKETFQQSL